MKYNIYMEIIIGKRLQKACVWNAPAHCNGEGVKYVFSSDLEIKHAH
jgi:hypothetical protein